MMVHVKPMIYSAMLEKKLKEFFLSREAWQIEQHKIFIEN